MSVSASVLLTSTFLSLHRLTYLSTTYHLPACLPTCLPADLSVPLTVQQQTLLILLLILPSYSPSSTHSLLTPHPPPYQSKHAQNHPIPLIISPQPPTTKHRTDFPNSPAPNKAHRKPSFNPLDYIADWFTPKQCMNLTRDEHPVSAARCGALRERWESKSINE
ncbi:hypothetical protein ACMFMG_009295 [Clarireedia jacksonii]